MAKAGGVGTWLQSGMTLACHCTSGGLTNLVTLVWENPRKRTKVRGLRVAAGGGTSPAHWTRRSPTR
jgi:hypothetical protein